MFYSIIIAIGIVILIWCFYDFIKFQKQERIEQQKQEQERSDYLKASHKRDQENRQKLIDDLNKRTSAVYEKMLQDKEEQEKLEQKKSKEKSL